MLYEGDLSSLAQGYTQAGLLHLASLVDAGVDDLVILPRGGLIPWNTFGAWLDGVRRARGSQREPRLVHGRPSQLGTLPVKPEGKGRVGLTAVDALPIARWLQPGLERALDALVVPSEYSRRGLEGVQLPVHVIPHPFPPELVVPLSRSRDPEMYVFGYVGSWNGRKNPEAVVRAYCRAFPTPTFARLSLKLTAEAGAAELVQAICREEARAHGNAAASDPDWRRADVVVRAAMVSEAEVVEALASTDCHVTACRGEAFGLATFRAAASGRPVIAPGWGAFPEYLSVERGDVLVPCKPMSVREAGLANAMDYSGDALLGDPDVQAMVHAMRLLAAERRRSIDGSRLVEAHAPRRLGERLREVVQA